MILKRLKSRAVAWQDVQKVKVDFHALMYLIVCIVGSKMSDFAMKYLHRAFTCT